MELKKLAEVFPADDIEWRVGRSGKAQNGKPWAMVLAYVTNRAIMQRLDDVCGPENWRNEFAKGPEGGVLCGLSIKVDGEWVTKWDGAENTDFESIKGGLSGAMKRAGVQWGIGRYLYDLKESWAEVVQEKTQHYDKLKTGEYFYWRPPALPEWALPKGTKQPKPESKPEPAQPKFNDLKLALLDFEQAGLVKDWEPIRKMLDEKDMAGLANAVKVLQKRSERRGDESLL